MDLIAHAEQNGCTRYIVDANLRVITDLDQASIQYQLASLLSFYWRSQSNQ
jgi:hypothetical protein